jgi:hypothetical protein
MVGGLGIPIDVVTTGSGWSAFLALAWLIVWLVLSGKLVPGRERDYWREAAMHSMKTARQAAETGAVTRDVLRALPRLPPVDRE